MNPATLIPVPDPLPIPYGWFDVLLIVTFTVHIILMNALVGSAAIGLVRSFKGKSQLAKDIGQKLPPLLALTINLGVAPLLFLQVNYGHFDYVSSVLMGGWWLAIIGALLFSYYGFYFYKFRFESLSLSWRRLIFGSSLAGLLFTGFMLTNNISLMLVPNNWLQYFSGQGGFLNLADPTLIPRYLHFMVGAVAVGGLWVALLGQMRKEDEYVESGMKWLTHATIANLAVGLWFLMAQPREILLAFMGGNVPATATLAASLGAAGMLLFSGFRKNPRSAAVWAVITVFLMACARHWQRVLMVSPWKEMDAIPVTHQYGSFYLFLGFLVGGLALIAYMVKLYFKARTGRA
ncbi:hypothetical protein GM415_02880 [Pseudodesulfovibrio cashew]|uniref:Uncharacterized protein n=1 Tax=Pseudodesulfovibrio cashew TaxID=2678688 RepID=A0A6I6JAM0_9BACT|nr:hypothetical protein [Pseudodesulfovibrio cashew]QGY39111.1 hypothetical protein GM415_02880 [Pseudodesulfovibrio cashew]